MNASLKKFSAYKTGGRCQAVFIPSDIEDLNSIINQLPEYPLIIGKGANILFSDKGYSFFIVYTGKLDSIKNAGSQVICEAGTEINKFCKYSLKHGISGFEFLYGMPGSVGGAVWMNARCYGKSVSEVLDWVEYLDESNVLRHYKAEEKDFAYKHSPFQGKKNIIVRAAFKGTFGDRKNIKKSMLDNYNDRKEKGHFRYPCAGSVFKNNRDFGAPSGRIIDECGLKGKKYGKAQIAPYHGNIIINRGGACSDDILHLIQLAEQVVLKKTGFKLEREIQLLGDWED